MLSEISIRNVVLIEALDLELGAGLTAMTGETGAGKSIILDALGMATGARSDKGLVRTGAAKAQCSASFTFKDDHKVWNMLAGADIDFDHNEDIVLRRTITAEGRSKAYINDAPVSVKLLSKIGGALLEVHGQHDGRGLLDPTTHQGQLDNFGGHDDLLATCSAAYVNLKTAIDALSALKSRQAKSDEDKMFFEHAIGELDRLAPTPGEDSDLASERKVLQHAEGALGELRSASEALGEDGEYESRIGHALAGLERVRGKIGDDASAAGSALQTASAALEKALLELDEARSAVGDAAGAFTFEPGRLETLEERLFALRAAARKYNVDVDGLQELRQKFGDELLAIEGYDDNLMKAEAAVEKSQKQYDIVARKLTKARKSAAARLDKKVVTELPPLKMERAQFITEITTIDDGPTGRDQVRFLVSTNPGTPIGPLEKIASGGELARFALAIKVALAAALEGQTQKVMIFDEVDQGVGGAVADAVGRRLSRLSDSAQVLVVTHSPQVAASANHQILISKSSKAGQTLTHVVTLAADDREEEIARMLAGEHVTDEARAAARKLMQAS
ncbi:MAG: DNA repair protein RecN [Robiginitomaculum sp.]|nr:DNA repair protein RecN [Robiginitomaculum sp.]